jgi:hypothetical protein
MAKTFATSFSIFAALLAGASLTGCGPSEPDAFSVDGSITVPAVAWKGNSPDERKTQGERCYYGLNGNLYPDVDAGAQVTLRDSSGATIGITSLGAGGHLLGWSAGLPPVYKTDNDFVKDFCVHYFQFEDIKSTDSFFSIEVARRGPVNYTREDLQSFVSLSLGN